MPLEICESDTSGVHYINFHSISASGLGDLQRQMGCLVSHSPINSFSVSGVKGLTYFLVFQKRFFESMY